MKSFTLEVTRLKNRFYYLLILLLLSFSGHSQNVGINATGAQPNAAAGLDVDFTNKGLLIPRVALTSTSSFAPLSAHVAGMVVYNTATTGDVTPGFYYDNGTKWIPGFLKGQSVGDMLYWSGSEWLRIPIGVPGQYLQISGGFIPTWGGNVYSTLTTTTASAITTTTATSGGNVVSDGGSAVIQRGVCWNTTGAPTVANSKTTDASGTGIFSSSLTGLLSGTTYHVRAYAINSTVVNYGDEITFTTLANIPTMAATTAATAITGNSATTGGSVTVDGGAPVTERGVCYGTTSNPTIAGLKVVDASTGVGSFTSNLTGLSGGTTYYVRAYATNSQGTAYGTQISFTTTVIPPTLTTVPVTNISGASATTGGSMAWNGGGYSNYQYFGVEYSVNPNFTAPSTKVNTNTSNYSYTTPVNPNPWVTNITGLAANTTYYIRSFLYIYRSGWTYAYGDTLSFTTTAPTAPVMGVTTAASLITGSTVRTGGAIISDGGSAITAKGVCWGITPNPTKGVGNYSSDGTGSATFVSNLTGLNGSTNYYVRAYATNAIGTTYSDVDMTFTTTRTSLYTVGQNVGYGWVAYIDPLTGGGFVVSPDIASTTGWGCSGTHIAVSANLGTGKANTDLIVATCGTTTAAGVAKAYTGGGFNDWYLPSSGEWAKIYTIANTIGALSGANNYYTSSEYLTSYTYAATYFTNGSTMYSSGAKRIPGGTDYVNKLRVIRDFPASPAIAPTVASTVAITDMTATTATSGGIIASDGGAAITEKGVCWSATANPTIADSKTTDGTGTTTFVSNITGLTTGTPYYVRAYATNSVGTSYGPEINFTPVAPGFPNVTTTEITNVLATSATSGGNVISDGGVAVTARGVCWSTTSDPTTDDSKTTDGTGTGIFASNITGLTTGLTYYVRAYSTNATGTSYGAEHTVTPITFATVSTDAITNIDATSATSGGNITNNGGSAVTDRGVCWSTTVNPTTANNTTSDGTGSGTFVSSITGLTNGVTYYVKAYATNGAGTAYGNEVSFTASGPGLPTVTTVQPTNGTSSTVTSGGNVTNDGGAAITARGVVYSSTSLPPTLLDPHTTDGTGTGTFTSDLSGLTAGNNYTIIAYATNSYGTAYGNEVNYTPIGLPTIGTGQLSYTAPQTFAQLPVYVPNTGGGTLSAYGAVWGTSPNPTVTTNLGKTTENLANYFMYQNAFISPLSQSTTYYVRGYATTENGTAYGTEISFTPGVAGLPTVETIQIFNKVGSLAEGEGNIISDGGDPFLTGGICWGLSADPTVDTNLGITTDGYSGQFYSTITGLTVGTTYHVRAYATNTTGTAYGANISFVATAATLGQVIQGGNIYGTVFQVDGTGAHGLIAESNPWMSTDWGCASSTTGATGTAVGDGMNNTTAITNDIGMNFCSSAYAGAPNYFDFAANASKWNGMDWYLPSKDEVDLIGLTSGTTLLPFSGSEIWSSSEIDATHAWYYNGTSWQSGLKTAAYLTWAIRSF